MTSDHEADDVMAIMSALPLQVGLSATAGCPPAVKAFFEGVGSTIDGTADRESLPSWVAASGIAVPCGRAGSGAR